MGSAASSIRIRKGHRSEYASLDEVPDRGRQSMKVDPDAAASTRALEGITTQFECRYVAPGKIPAPKVRSARRQAGLTGAQLGLNGPRARQPVTDDTIGGSTR